MKSRKNRMKRGGGGFMSYADSDEFTVSVGTVDTVGEAFGGSKRKSRKSRKTKKGRGSHEGGKKKCPKHCRRHTHRTRKGLKHHKN